MTERTETRTYIQCDRCGNEEERTPESSQLMACISFHRLNKSSILGHGYMCHLCEPCTKEFEAWYTHMHRATEFSE